MNATTATDLLLRFYHICMSPDRAYSDYDAPENLYVKYFNNFKYLVHWLEPRQLERLVGEPVLPSYMMTYDMQELARYLGCSQYYVFTTLYGFYREVQAPVITQQIALPTKRINLGDLL